MKQHDGATGHFVQVSAHALKVKATRLGLVVRVLLYWDSLLGKDIVVVAPCRVRHIDGRTLLECPNARSCKSQPSCARQALHTACPAFLHWRTVVAKHQLQGCIVELGDTVNGQVFFVDLPCLLHLKQLGFGRLHGGQHPWRALFGTVRAHTEVQLVRGRGGPERLGHAQDGIWGRHRHVGEEAALCRRGLQGSGAGQPVAPKRGVVR
mmetsp:Transcript_129875/g.224525  ORF Transcript_129875/g.224525 Transcript_129875/m.224525 type:complete len:208 (+) Transcript_129875:1590-2213(+)